MWHHQIRLHTFWRRVLDNHVTISYKIPVILQVKLQDTFFHLFLVTWDPALFKIPDFYKVKPPEGFNPIPTVPLGQRYMANAHTPFTATISDFTWWSPLCLSLSFICQAKRYHLCNWAHTKSQDTGWPNANLPNAPPLHPELHMDNPFKIFKRLSELAAFCHLKILA